MKHQPTPEQREALILASERLMHAIKAFQPILGHVAGRRIVIHDSEAEDVLGVFLDIVNLRHRIWKLCPEAK